MKSSQDDLLALTDGLQRKVLDNDKIEWDEIRFVLACITEDKDKGLYGLVCFYASHYMLYAGRLEESIYFVNESIRCMQNTPYEKELCRSYNISGMVSYCQNNLILAMEQYEKACIGARKYSKSLTFSMAKGNMAEAYHRVESYDKALECYKEALEELEKRGRGSTSGELIYRKMLAGYGDCLLHVGKLARAEGVAGRLKELLADNNTNATVRLAGYSFLANFSYEIHEKQTMQEYVEAAVQAILDGCPMSAALEHILNLLQFLAKIKDFEHLQMILDHTEPQAAIEQNEGFLLQLLLYRLQYCSEDMERDSFLADTQTFFKLKKEHENAENSQALRVMRLREKLREHEKEQARLLEENTMLLYKMDHDELSGLHNKRSLNRYLEDTFEEAMSRKEKLGLLFVDIDYFKPLNDTYGHQKGDECIVAIAGIIEECVADDYVARYGGDEFVVVTLNRSDEYLAVRAEEIVQRVKECKVYKPDSLEKLQLSVTVGGANAIPVFPNKIWDFLTAADETLYAQKDMQKGCVRFYEGQGDTL